jgi:hypothetical protein
MAKKKFFCIVDTETTQTEKVADIGIVVCDKQGRIAYEGGFMIAETYCNAQEHPLFHVFGDPKDVFSAASLPARRRNYDAMIADGRRMVASVAAINSLLAKINARYSPVLTAYNLHFDLGKCANTGIDLTHFSNRFCLWAAAAQKWGHSRAYLEFILENGYLGNRTKTGHIGVQTKADVVAKFILGAGLPDEPHTALEDARDYERPILAALVKNTSPSVYMDARQPRWQDYAAKNLFKVA